MENIIDCEHAYSSEYCDVYEDYKMIRFADYFLPEMRDHNYTYIKNKNVLIEIIDDEIKICGMNKQNFLKIVFDVDDNNFELSKLSYDYNIDKIGYYCFDISCVNSIKSEKNLIIKKVNQYEMIEDIIFCDLEFDSDLSRKKFHIKKNKRRGKVYLSNSYIDAYICYDGNNVVGICDLFIYDGVAKIENFLVIPKYQRKGYGTFILKKMIDIALENDVNLIYLITDEADTAKEMYKKLHFNKIGERIELIFDLT